MVYRMRGTGLGPAAPCRSQVRGEEVLMSVEGAGACLRRVVDDPESMAEVRAADGLAARRTVVPGAGYDFTLEQLAEPRSLEFTDDESLRIGMVDEEMDAVVAGSGCGRTHESEGHCGFTHETEYAVEPGRAGDRTRRRCRPAARRPGLSMGQGARPCRGTLARAGQHRASRARSHRRARPAPRALHSVHVRRQSEAAREGLTSRTSTADTGCIASFGRVPAAPASRGAVGERARRSPCPWRTRGRARGA